MKFLNRQTRAQVFKLSPFADNFIAQMQQSFASELDVNNKAESALLSKYYDHQKPSCHQAMIIEGHAVMAFIAANRETYFTDLPLPVFFSKLETEQLFFIDFLDTSMSDFPFENFRKRNTLKKMLGGSLAVDAFSLNAIDVVKVLELFYFSRRYERSAITMIADGRVPVALRLCRDGNFHINYLAEYESKVRDAAVDAGFIVGDIDLCWNYKVE